MSTITGETKPSTLAPRFENIPDELTRIHGWVGWCWERRERKWTKPPRMVDGRPASSTDPATWAPLEDVCAVYDTGPYDGVGFVLDPALGFVGFDLDHVIDERGTIHPEALRIVAEADSYTEWSPSGTGLRIIARGTLPAGWRNARTALAFPIECYSEGRYLTITGHHLAGTPRTIEERTAAVAALHARVAAAIDAGNGHQRSQTSPSTASTIPDDARLLERARTARNGAKFAALWAGDTSAHGGDDSAADLALCSLLAFWTARDAARMDRLFRQSGLMRPKWDKRRGATQTYGERTISKAIKECGETYRGADIATDTAGPSADGLGLVALGELLGEPEEAHAWIVAKRLPAAGLGMIAGKPKAGKSTLARCLALAVSRGARWLGFETTQGLVIYLALEAKRGEIREHFRALGATGDDPILVLCASAPLDALERLRLEARRHRPVLIIIDPLFRFVRVDDGNDYATMTAALEPLMTLARESGACVLLVHHLGKGERSDGDNVLGSTAIFGAVDSALLMKRSERFRTLASIQRYGEDLEEITLDLDPVTRNVTAGSTRAEAEQADAGRLILEFLTRARAAVTEAEIGDGVECRTQPQRAALRALVAAGTVARTGRGGKGDPFRYSAGTRTPEGSLL